MTDLLVNLYDLDLLDAYFSDIQKHEIHIRRGLVPEKLLVSAWVNKTFGSVWASECEVSFTQQPVSCFIAVRSEELLGFSCYNTTFKGFFGPIGVDPECRSMGVGRALLISSLNAMAAQGYAYAIIGGVGSRDFFDKSMSTFEIPGSSPGAYKGMLKQK